MRRLFIVLSFALVSALPLPACAQSRLETKVQSVLTQLMSGWDAGSGAQYAAAFSPDADFVPYFGAHIHGRDAIAAAHQPAFDAFLRGSTLHLQVQSVRPLGHGVVLVHTLGWIAPADGPAPPTPTSLQSFVMVERRGALVIEAFQNTEIHEPPGPR